MQQCFIPISLQKENNKSSVINYTGEYLNSFIDSLFSSNREDLAGNLMEMEAMIFSKKDLFLKGIIMGLFMTLSMEFFKHYSNKECLEKCQIALSSIHSLNSSRELFYLFKASILEIYSILHNHSEKDYGYISYVKNYIKGNYEKDICVTEMANRIHVSRNYLSILFKKETGETIMNYLIRCRIERAKEYINNGSYKMCEISEMAGYRDPAYFSKAFKKVTGYTPNEYRKQFLRKVDNL